MQKKIVYILFVFFLSSCGLNKKYQRPAVPTVENYRNYSAKDSTSLGTINWRTYFDDSLLINLIDTALANNFDILRAEQSLKIANSLFRQANAQFYPSINFGVSGSVSKPSTTTFSGQNIPASQAVTDISIGPTFNWELDIWGKLRSQKKATLASYNKSVHDRQFIQCSMINAVVNYYYLLQSLDAKTEILKATIINRVEGIETNKALKIAGSVTEVAVKQNEALLYNAQALLQDVINQIAITENTLSVLIGKAPDDIRRSKLNTNVLPTKEWETGFPTQLLTNRTDINAAEQNLINAFEMVNFANASFYPTIGLSGQGGLNSMNFSKLFDVHSLFASIAGSIMQPLFNRRNLKTQKEVNVAKQEIALLDFKEKIITAYSEVANEINTLNVNADKLKLKEMERDALYQSIVFSEELQKQGFVNYLEVLTAKNNELNAELSLIDIQLKILTSKANLYKALGGGWK